MFNRGLLVIFAVVSLSGVATGCSTQKDKDREMMMDVMEANIRSGKDNVSFVTDDFTEEELELMELEVKERLEEAD